MISMIKIQLRILIILSITQLHEAYNDLIDSAQLYSDHFSLFQSLDSFELFFAHNKVTVTNFRAILQSKQIIFGQISFIFLNNLYSYVFDIQIYSKHSINITRNEIVIDFNISQISFVKQMDNTFEISISKLKSECYYHMDDILEYGFFRQINTSKVLLCTFLTDIIINKMKNFVELFPPNNHRLNIEDLIWRILKNTPKVIDCDYQLNETHTVLDLVFEDFTYSSQIEFEHWSMFKKFQVIISYSVINSKHVVNRRKDNFSFNFLGFGKGIMNFSYDIQGDRNFAPLISFLINKFELARRWILD